MQLSKKIRSIGMVLVLSSLVPVFAANVPLIVQLRSSVVEVQGRQITVSPNFQVVLQFPQAIDLVSGNNTSAVKVTVPDPPQDHFILLDPLTDHGQVTLNVISGGKVLPLTLLIDSKATSGTRKYVFNNDVEAGDSPEAGVSVPLDKGATLPRPPGQALTVVTGGAAEVPSLAQARQNLTSALTRLQHLQTLKTPAAQPGLSLSARFLPAQAETTDVLVLTVTNSGPGTVTLRGSDLSLALGGRAMTASVGDLVLKGGDRQTVELDLGLRLAEKDTLSATWKTQGEAGQQTAPITATAAAR